MKIKNCNHKRIFPCVIQFIFYFFLFLGTLNASSLYQNDISRLNNLGSAHNRSIRTKVNKRSHFSYNPDINHNYGGTQLELKKKNSFYFGFALGYGGLVTPSWDITLTPSYELTNKSKGFSKRIMLGYLQRHKNLEYGLEVGYNFYPRNSSTTNDDLNNWQTLSYEGYSYDLLMQVRYLFLSNCSLLLQFGGAYTEQLTRYSLDHSDDHGFEENRSRFLPEIAVGINYKLTSHWRVGLSYHRLFGNEPAKWGTVNTPSHADSSRVASVKLYFLQLVYNFN